jgi:hypothetical protein
MTRSHRLIKASISGVLSSRCLSSLKDFRPAQSLQEEKTQDRAGNTRGQEGSKEEDKGIFFTHQWAEEENHQAHSDHSCS